MSDLSVDQDRDPRSPTPLRDSIAAVLASEPAIAEEAVRAFLDEHKLPDDLQSRQDARSRLAETHKIAATGSLRAAAALESLPACPVTLSDGTRSATIWAARREGSSLWLYLDEIQSDEGALVITNPPTLVEHPAGPVELPSGRFREDPLAALTAVVLEHAGVEKSPERPFRELGGSKSRSSLKHEVVAPRRENG